MNTLIKLREIGYGYNPLMKLTVEEDPENSTANILKLEPPYLEVNIHSSEPEAYRDKRLMGEAVSLLGVYTYYADTEIYHLLELTFQLSINAYEDRRMKDTYKKLTVAEIINIAPEIDWLRYFRAFVGIDINENEAVVVKNVKFFRRLGALINRTEKRKLANYMIWRFVEESFPLLSEQWRAMQKLPETTRLDECLSSIRNNLGVAFSAFFFSGQCFEDEFNNNYTADTQNVKKMFTPILQAFTDSLENNIWLDNTTKLKVKNKAQAIIPRFEYPTELFKDSYVSEMYSNLTFDSNSYFQVMKAVRLWKTNYSFSQLRKPNIKNDWRKYDKAPAIKPYYNYMENSIEFPAGVLRYGFYNKNLPDYLKFGTIGYLIGREILSGFDEKGRLIDENGNKVRWWPFSQDTDYKLMQHKTCNTNDYFDYVTHEGYLNYRTEMIFESTDDYMAYSSGLKAAYEGYKKWSSKRPEEFKLFGLNYTQKQLFWISAANLWCDRADEYYSLQLFHTSVNNPRMYRVIGPVFNIPEFAEDFGCPEGSKMRRKNGCHIW